MTTFSQVVDELVTEFIRKDLLTTGVVPAYLNQTIREVHTGKDKKVLRFGANRVEVKLSNILVANGYTWEIPRAHCFQAVEAVLYPEFGIYARNKKPGSVDFSGDSRADDTYYWYQSGPNLCFFSYSQTGSINVSMFYYPRSLVYQPVEADRWAVFDVEEETWRYKSGTGRTSEELQELSTNWILMKWTEMIKEGVRAKLFKRLGDQYRATMAYSAYESQRAEMQMQEAWVSGPYWEK